jgi:nucleoredoxin
MLFSLTASSLFAEFAKWTNKEGRAVDLELLEVTGEGEQKVGVFKMRTGRTVEIKKADLNEESGKLLDEWSPASTESTSVAKPSVFDDLLDDNLVILDSRKLKKYAPRTKPSKYYVFYYTASWCGPCQAFTPSLVSFYKKYKNDSFELILISSDEEEEDMVEYAKDKRMPWPQLELSKADDFKKEFRHGVKGIPSVIVCDLEGKIVSRDGRDLNTLKELIK